MCKNKSRFLKKVKQYILKRIETKHSNKNLDMNVHGSIIHNSQKVEATQMPINR